MRLRAFRIRSSVVYGGRWSLFPILHSAFGIRNSLRFRLLLTMSIVVLVAVGVIAVLTSNSTTNEFQRYVQVDTQRNQQVVSDFMSAYQSDPSTKNLQVIVKNMANKGSDRFVVVDGTGYVIADSDGTLVGKTISRQGPPDFVFSADGATGVTTFTTGVGGFEAGLPFHEVITSTDKVADGTGDGKPYSVGGVEGGSSVAAAPFTNTFGEKAGRLFSFGFIPVAVIPPPTDTNSSAEITGQGSPLKTSLMVARLPQRGNPVQAGFLDSVRQELIIAVAVAGLVALLLTWLMSRRILGPVEALTAAAGRMEKGDLSQHVEVKSHDEIGKLAHAFNSMTDGLSTLEQLRRNMVTDVAHELRTPIANIRGYLEAMQDGIVKPDPVVIESLHEEAMLLTRLVEDLQELELAEAGKLKLVRQQIEPAQVVEKAVTATLPAAAEKGITLKTTLPDDLPEIEADPERIGQVLRNLLNNAIKHTPNGGYVEIAASVVNYELRARSPGAGRRAGPGNKLPSSHTAFIEMSVKDSGPGIAPEHLQHIFDRFYRADQSRARSTGGAGLGLAIVKELVEMHGGRVRAESTPGQGAAFYFTLPVGS